MKNSFSISLLLVALSFGSNGQTSNVAKDDPLEATFAQMINCDDCPSKLSDYRSKIVIMDFWATWCAPCIKSFPLLAELQTRYPDDVVVLTVTDEDEERVRRFLKKNTLNLPIILDKDKELAKIFPHSSIPHTVIIDREGMLAATTHPQEITDEVMTKLLGGESVGLKVDTETSFFESTAPLVNTQRSDYSVTITGPREGAFSGMFPILSEVYIGRRILLVNMSLKGLYKIAYDFPDTRTRVEVEDNGPFESGKICFDLIVPDSLGPRRFEIMRSLLGAFYEYDAKLESRAMKVKVLSIAEGKKLNIEESSPEEEMFVQYGSAGLSMRGAKLENVAEFLEDRLGIPVINEIANESLFNLELSWYYDDPEAVLEEIRELGLELRDEERPVELLIIADRK